MTRETIDITDEIRESEEKGIRIEYYTLDGEKPEIHMRPGDLMIICNVLHDYAKMLEEAADISIGYEQGLYRCHVDRCEKIRNKIETAMGYSTEATIEKCHKKKKSTSGRSVCERIRHWRGCPCACDEAAETEETGISSSNGRKAGAEMRKAKRTDEHIRF